MHHDMPLISTIVAGLVLAFILGMIANRFRMPPLVGYLVAGILVGPYTPGFVADQELGAELAELGVILLMFGVGLHFSLKDLMSVRALAIPGAVVQIGVATTMGLGLGLMMGWDIGAGLLFGLALSVASTVVLLKALQERRLIETERGRIAVGWLIVEDLAMVLALVLVPAFAALAGNGDSATHDPFVSFIERIFNTQLGIWGVLVITIVKVAAFVGFMLIVGRRLIPWALHATAHTGSRELFRLAVLAIALGVALGSANLFGVSLALGAFFAGMILSESELSHRAAQETLPLRDAFSVLFFVSVGMLFDPSALVTNPLPLLVTVFIIVIGKSVAAFGIVILFGRPLATALTISASLAQIGEFSFILASMGVALAIMPPEGQDLILAGALISIILNPLTFWLLELVRPRLEQRWPPRPTRADEEVIEGPITTPEAGTQDVMAEVVAEAGDASAAAALPRTDTGDGMAPTTKSAHTVLVGFGRVGSIVGEGLHAQGEPLVVVEDGDISVAMARAMGIEVVVGNAASTDVQVLANFAGAQTLLVAIPNAFEAGQVVEQARRLNPAIRIIARAHSDEEEGYLANLGADTVIMGEREIGLGMLAWVRGDRAELMGVPLSSALEAAERTEVAPAEPPEPELANSVPELAGVSLPEAVEPPVGTSEDPQIVTSKEIEQDVVADGTDGDIDPATPEGEGEPVATPAAEADAEPGGDPEVHAAGGVADGVAEAQGATEPSMLEVDIVDAEAATADTDMAATEGEAEIVEAVGAVGESDSIPAPGADAAGDDAAMDGDAADKNAGNGETEGDKHRDVPEVTPEPRN